jgi:hypothetical protein
MTTDKNIKKTKLILKDEWLFRVPISVLTESSIFICFSFLLLGITPVEFHDNALNIIFESVGINSFFITLILSIIILPYSMYRWGPYIDPLDIEHYENWLFEIFRYDDKFRNNYIKLNRKHYELFFLQLNQFNLSLGIGTLGVMIGLLLWQFIYFDLKNVYQLSSIIGTLFVYILVAKFVKYVAYFKHFNEYDIKPSTKSIKVTSAFTLVVACIFSYFVLPDIYKKLSVPEKKQVCEVVEKQYSMDIDN